LEAKWPEKYNSAGHHNWQGRIYGAGLTGAFSIRRALIYQGKWGSAPFQSIYAPQTSSWSALTLVPEWFLVVALLAGLSLLGIKWPPLLWTTPLLFFAIAMPVTQAIMCAMRAPLPLSGASRSGKIAYRGVSAGLHLVQPIARLAGRLQYGLTPWRKRAGNGAAIIGRCNRHFHIWSEHWLSSAQWLGKLENLLRAEKLPLVCGGDFDSWDLEIRGGLFGRARLLMATEEHNGGRQQLRFHVWSLFSVWAVAVMGIFGILGLVALLDGSYMVAGILLGLAALLITRSRYEALTAVVSYSEAIQALDEQTRNSDPGLA